MDFRAVLVVFGLAAVFWSMVRWKRALQLAFVLVILEGAIRKWLVPGAQDLVYFAKDGVLLGVYAGYLRSAERSRSRLPPLPGLSLALAAGTAYGLLEVFNPALPNLLVGILGFKAYFFYVPLLYVMPAAFPTDVELGRFLRRYSLISIPVGLLALAQFFSPASSPLNTYARGGGDAEGGYVTTFGTSAFVRVTGTFSYISGYASYLFATAILLLAVMSVLHWRFKGHLKIYLALGMTCLGMLMTGSRGPVVILVVLFPLYWGLAVARERQSGATFGRLLLGLALLAAFLAYAGPQAIDAFQGRAAGSEDTLSRLTAPFVTPVQALSDAGAFGFGIGATHQTAAAVTKGIAPYSWLHGVNTEAETGRVVIEMGPLGFLLVYWVRFYLAFFALAQVFKLRSRFHRSLAVAAFLFFLAQIPGSVVFDVTSDVYYWFFAGLLTTAICLETPERAKAQRPSLAAPPRRREALQPEPARP